MQLPVAHRARVRYNSPMVSQAGGVFVSTDRPVLLRLGLLVFALSFALGAWRRFAVIHHFDPMTAGFAMLVGVFVVSALALPTTRFVFDPARKIITWSSGSLTNSNGGQLEFSQISNVVLQISASSNVLTYRVALKTGDQSIPLGVEYSGNRAAAEGLARRIRLMLGMPGDAPIDDAPSSHSSL